jgi:hypothetical protein
MRIERIAADAAGAGDGSPEAAARQVAAAIRTAAGGAEARHG